MWERKKAEGPGVNENEGMADTLTLIPLELRRGLTSPSFRTQRPGQFLQGLLDSGPMPALDEYPR